MCEIRKAGSCCSNWEPPDQIGRVGMLDRDFNPNKTGLFEGNFFFGEARGASI